MPLPLSSHKGQEKEEEMGGGNVYSKLKNPSENVCMTAMASSSPKHKGNIGQIPINVLI